MKINLHITDAKKVFSEKDRKAISDGINRAEKFITSRLNISEDVDIVVVPDLPRFLIAEDKLGAFTYTGNFILLSFVPNSIEEDLVYEVTCHEMCHAGRWQKNKEDMKNLFDGMILEGLGVALEEEAVKKQDNKQYFFQTILRRSDKENDRILSIIKSELDSADYDYFSIFISGDKKRKIPRWAGYSVGYYIVKKYLDKTGKSIEEAFADKYDDFRVVLV